MENIKRSPGGAIIPEGLKVTVVKPGRHSLEYHLMRKRAKAIYRFEDPTPFNFKDPNQEEDKK